MASCIVATDSTMRLSLTARTPGVNSAARRIACFSARERTTPHSSTVPSWTITLSREVVSRADLPAICDLQGDFQKLQGEPILLSVKFSNGFDGLEWVPASTRSRERFGVLQRRFWEI